MILFLFRVYLLAVGLYFNYLLVIHNWAVITSYSIHYTKLYDYEFKTTPDPKTFFDAEYLPSDGSLMLQ